MTLTEFAHEIISVAMTSSLCDVPSVRRLTPTAINLRLPITTGGWHVHPCASPGRHDPLPEPMAFAAFMVELERRASVNANPGVERHPDGNSNAHKG